MKANNFEYQEMDEILIKYISLSATDEERDYVLNWIKESNENLKYYERFRKFYQISKLTQIPSGYNKTEGWNRVKAGYYKARFLMSAEEKQEMLRKVIRRIAIPAAAAVFIAFFAGIWTSDYRKDSQLSGTIYNEISVPMGAKSQLTLSDGSKIWLNAGSKFRYPSIFSGETREVFLEGEAYFDVKHIDDKLFVVRTSGISIKVYGTQFNVKSYPEENKVTTTLVNGSVAIETPDKTKSIIYLKPKETATYYLKESKIKPIEGNSKKNNKEVQTVPAKEIVVIPKIDPVPVVSWKDSKWVIVSEELGDLAVKLERRYNAKISFDKEQLKKYKFSGTLTTETFEQVLKVIQLSAPINFSIQNNNVIFYEDQAYRKKYDKMILK